MEPIDLDYSKLNNLLLAELKSFAKNDVELEEVDASHEEISFSFKPKRYPSDEELKSMNSAYSIKIGDKLYVEVNTGFYQYRVQKNGNISYINIGTKRLPFKSLSLQFYHNDMLLCKADWACVFNSAGNEQEHPQPHWHFDPEQIFPKGEEEKTNSDGKDVPRFTEVLRNEKPAAIPAFKPKEAQEVEKESTSKIAYPLVKIHFATSSKWPDNDNENSDITEDRLKHWFKHCISSILTEHQQYV